MKPTPVSLWLDEKFRAWRAEQRSHRAGVTQFAKYIGIRRDDLNNYMLKGVSPEGERLEKIGQVLGPEIYDRLGLPRPDPQVRQVTEAFMQLPEAQRGVAEAVLRRPGLLNVVAQMLAPAAKATPALRRTAKDEWRDLVRGLDDDQVLRLLAVARAMRDQELKEKEK